MLDVEFKMMCLRLAYDSLYCGVTGKVEDPDNVIILAQKFYDWARK